MGAPPVPPTATQVEPDQHDTEDNEFPALVFGDGTICHRDPESVAISVVWPTTTWSTKPEPPPPTATHVLPEQLTPSSRTGDAPTLTPG